MTLEDWQKVAPSLPSIPTRISVKDAAPEDLSRAIGVWQEALTARVRHLPLQAGDSDLVQASRLDYWPGESYKFDLRIDGRVQPFAINKPRLLPHVSVKKFWRALSSALQEACHEKKALRLSEIHFSHVHPIFDIAQISSTDESVPLTVTGVANLSDGDLGISLWLSKVFPQQMIRLRAVTLSDYAYEIQFVDGKVVEKFAAEGENIACDDLIAWLALKKNQFFSGIKNPIPSGYFDTYQNAALSDPLKTVPP